MGTADTETTDHVLLYGSLLSFLSTQEELGVKHSLKLLGHCALQGRLYDLGDYPGLVMNHADSTIVMAELYQCLDQQVLHTLFEDYRPGDEAGSLYIRHSVSLDHPVKEAWTYVYNRPVSESAFIPCGNWKRHLAEKND